MIQGFERVDYFYERKEGNLTIRLKGRWKRRYPDAPVWECDSDFEGRIEVLIGNKIVKCAPIRLQDHAAHTLHKYWREFISYYESTGDDYYGEGMEKILKNYPKVEI